MVVAVVEKSSKQSQEEYVTMKEMTEWAITSKKDMFSAVDKHASGEWRSR